jgi:hypothetical protein
LSTLNVPEDAESGRRKQGKAGETERETVRESAVISHLGSLFWLGRAVSISLCCLSHLAKVKAEQDDVGSRQCQYHIGPGTHEGPPYAVSLPTTSRGGRGVPHVRRGGRIFKKSKGTASFTDRVWWEAVVGWAGLSRNWDSLVVIIWNDRFGRVQSVHQQRKQLVLIIKFQQSECAVRNEDQELTRKNELVNVTRARGEGEVRTGGGWDGASERVNLNTSALESTLT